MPGHRDNELLRQGQIVEKAKAMGGDGLVFTVQPAGVNALGVSEWLFKGKVIVYDSDRSEKQEIGNDQMLTSKLLGRWESVAIKLKGPGAERMTMTFLSDSRFTCTSVEKGKTYPGSGYYFVKNGKLILTDNPDGQAKPEDAVDMIISGNFLMTTSEALGMAITYQKIQ